MITQRIFASTLIAFVCAMLLSGCGLAMGKKVDFGTDYQNLDDAKMKELAGKTYFITNEDDYQQLVALKSELRTLVNSGTPNRFTIIDKTSRIEQITKQYFSGALGAIYPSRWENQPKWSWWPYSDEWGAWVALIMGLGFVVGYLQDRWRKMSAK
jgi:hypothetical protein